MADRNGHQGIVHEPSRAAPTNAAVEAIVSPSAAMLIVDTRQAEGRAFMRGMLDRLAGGDEPRRAAPLYALEASDRHQLALWAIDNAKHPAVLERETRAAFAADQRAQREAA